MKFNNLVMFVVVKSNFNQEISKPDNRVLFTDAKWPTPGLYLVLQRTGTKS